MRTKLESQRLLSLIVLIGICQMAELPGVYAQNTVHTTTLGEHNAVTPEISTEQLERILADGSEPVLDVRFAQEYAIAHIPGSIKIYEKEIDAIIKQFPDKTQRMVLYCNGPFCGKSKRVSPHRENGHRGSNPEE